MSATELRARVRGDVLEPGAPGFAEATRIWNGMVRRAPALAVRVTSTDDVVAAVDHAREEGMPLAVRGGGHHIAGTALADGGITLDMSALRGVAVDPDARTAVVEPGCLLADVDAATQAHGLATPLGYVSEVGVAGLTLGGGLGYLTRRFGWTVDNLRAVEIVTADGRVRRASRLEHPDLFWAVRGAGANMGVVTRFELDLHPVGPIVHGGLIAWPFARAEAILDAYRRITSEAPRELAAFLVLLRAPPAPFVPAAWHGEQVCAMSICFSGDPREAASALAPIRGLGEPVFDLLAEQPYVQVQSHLDAAEPAGDHYYWKTGYASELSDDLLRTARELALECPMPRGQVGFLHVGGALNERAPDDGAVGNRDARFAMGAIGVWEPRAEGASGVPGWIRAAGERLRSFGTGGGYVNFQTADEGEARVRAAYGANYARVAEIKARYDPGNLFRSNRNVAPRAARAAV